ncbi:MAG: hypothetical protein JWM64_566, partial [Frankiales bacterium]|nr:hypothetical protein [Frankiales bacterium]
MPQASGALSDPVGELGDGAEPAGAASPGAGGDTAVPLSAPDGAAAEEPASALPPDGGVAASGVATDGGPPISTAVEGSGVEPGTGSAGPPPDDEPAEDEAPALPVEEPPASTRPP